MIRTITFRVPVVDKTTKKSKPPFMNFRCSDDTDRWRSCGHRHKLKSTAERCAYTMSLGETLGSVNQRIEIRGFGRRVLVGDGFTAAQRRRAEEVSR